MNTFKEALDTPPARRMMLEAKAYTHALPESLMIGAQHLLNWLEVRATADERKKNRDTTSEAKGRLKRG